MPFWPLGVRGEWWASSCPWPIGPASSRLCFRPGSSISTAACAQCMPYWSSPLVTLVIAAGGVGCLVMAADVLGIAAAALAAGRFGPAGQAGSF
jgi:hypothetical protein